jgi:hypothetical protein
VARTLAFQFAAAYVVLAAAIGLLALQGRDAPADA